MTERMTERDLELLLMRYRCATPMPDFRNVRQERRPRSVVLPAMAAAIVIAVGIAVFVPRARVLRP